MILKTLNLFENTITDSRLFDEINLDNKQIINWDHEIEEILSNQSDKEIIRIRLSEIQNKLLSLQDKYDKLMKKFLSDMPENRNKDEQQLFLMMYNSDNGQTIIQKWLAPNIGTISNLIISQYHKE